MALAVPKPIAEYHRAGKPCVCELDVQPWICEFWPAAELEDYNVGYQVPTYAPGYFGFATSGGGEMYALSPSGAVVCLPFIGMSADEELVVTDSWSAFERLLRAAP